MTSAGGEPTRHPIPAEIGRRARAIREGLGFSQERLGQIIGVHRTYIGAFERGEQNSSVVNLVKIAVGLGVDPGQLIAGLGSPLNVRRSSA